MSDTLHSQKCVVSKVTGADDEISPTLLWPKHDLQRLQVDNQQSSHLGGRTQRPFESKTDDSKFDIADSRPRVLAPIESKGRGFMKKLLRISRDCYLQANLIPNAVNWVCLIKPHAEGRAPSAPWADLCSQPSPAHLDTKSALYAGEKLMPKLVTAESCVGEGIPDPTKQ